MLMSVCVVGTGLLYQLDTLAVSMVAVLFDSHNFFVRLTE